MVSFLLLMFVLEYQTTVMRRDIDMADYVLQTVPWDQRTTVVNFLEIQGSKLQAISTGEGL